MSHEPDFSIDRKSKEVLSSGIPELGVPIREGKVREVYNMMKNNELLFLSTDRISAFDRIFGSVPNKGEILTELCVFWFRSLTKDHPEIPHHLIANPDPNGLIVKKLQIFPIEFVMRAYLTGTTSTSIWKGYEEGERDFGGVELPDDLCKNSSLPEVILTPSTKSSLGDKNISEEEILEQKLMSVQAWNLCKKYSHRLFDWGSKVAKERGLVLVDTKYEFGVDAKGKIYLADEIHTPDSSRYWIQEDISEAFKENREPKSFDKEWFRHWLQEEGDPYSEEFAPDIPEEIVVRIRDNYIHLYEKILQKRWEPKNSLTKDRIIKNIELYRSSRGR